MKFDWNEEKQRHNIRAHKLDFSFAELVFSDPCRVGAYDRYEGGEHRWHMYGMVGGSLLLVVHSYPDEDDHEWVRVIGLREATRQERHRYEEENLDG